MDAVRLEFHEMGLDDRLLKAVADLGWSHPTLIQEKAVPLALEGKDLLARARTGSGKTAAYAIPIIQRILASKQSVREQDVRALVLVPTKELGQQVQTMIRQLTAFCSRDVRVADVTGKADLSAQRSNLVLHSSLEMLVVDEADLLFSFGFEDDLKSLLCHLPKIYQSFLMSATLTEDVQALKELLLHNPVILKLQGSQLPDSSQLQQYSIKCGEEDKFLLVYTLLKLRLVQGKTLVFVGAVDRSYRLKLFLEQFGIPSCVLNSELPVQSRCHIITQFNQGFYDYIIATDEESLADPAAAPQAGKGKKKKKKKSTERGGGTTKDKEFGVSRGVDFQNVANVVNFDFPLTAESYIHRVGRTARADNPGTALSFIAHTELSLLEEVEEALTGDNTGTGLKPYEFKMEEIEGFRYRCRLLRHDKDLHPAVVKPHLRNVPEYLIPETLKGVVNPLSNRRRRKKLKTQPEGVVKSSFKKNIPGKNPLRSFKYSAARNPRGKAGPS
ncbi:putative ATP-dependent RNA helicase DDX56 [Liparis tanakae]|uniref:RNA helicase n=1 Tax=Liparis tanakae TaxID=230148 RepID=A0A4Z2FMI7_9TELE|nr:putative ATP-dependent RNA helicase DDX56 [Liparis tanakae]